MNEGRDLLHLAEQAADQAARFLVEGWSRSEVVATKSSGTDIVTQMDQGSERLLVERILAARPDDGILGEEGGRRQGSSGVCWVIDPLDGTVNYSYGLPVWAVSVGVTVAGRPTVGVVHAPALGKVWTGIDAGSASRAHVNGRPIAVSDCTELGSALVATGFGYRADVRAEQAMVVAALLPEVRDIRRAGAAAVDMCWVAEGVLDGYYERGTHEWDRAAGTAIARAAGAVVGGLGDEPPGEAMVVVANPGLWPGLQGALRQAGA